MECQRLQKLVKNWYQQVQDEAMAPGRMVAFMDAHLLECEVCRADPMVQEEVSRIRAMVISLVKVAKSTEDETASQEPEAEEVEETYVDDDNDEPDEIDED